MYPHERSLVQRLKNKPFVLFGINASDEPELLKKLVADGVLTWPFWVDGDSGPIVSEWRVQAFPTIYVIDHQGVIRFKDLREESLDQAIDSLLVEAEAAAKAVGK